MQNIVEIENTEGNNILLSRTNISQSLFFHKIATIVVALATFVFFFATIVIAVGTIVVDCDNCDNCVICDHINMKNKFIEFTH